MLSTSSLSDQGSPEDAILRFTSVIADLAPAVKVLLARESGHEVQVPLVVGAGAAWAVEGLRERMERPAVAALGATLMRVWPPARFGNETWTLAVHRDRVDLLTHALAKRTVFPLVLVYQSAWELERVAPAVAEGEPEIGVHDDAEHRHRRPSSHFLRLVTVEQLDQIDEALRQNEISDAKGPFPGIWGRSALGGGTAVLREAVRQARSHPMEVAA